jgi:hemerythrin
MFERAGETAISCRFPIGRSAKCRTICPVPARALASDGTRAISIPPALEMLDALATGVEAIDADHRDLIERCNALTTMVAGQAPWCALHDAARRLAEHCLLHFKREETILAQAGFPRCETHMHEHRRFGAKFSELADRFAEKDVRPQEHLTIVNRLRELLIDLLLRHDLDYKSYLDHAVGR